MVETFVSVLSTWHNREVNFLRVIYYKSFGTNSSYSSSIPVDTLILGVEFSHFSFHTIDVMAYTV